MNPGYPLKETINHMVDSASFSKRKDLEALVDEVRVYTRYTYAHTYTHMYTYAHMHTSTRALVHTHTRMHAGDPGLRRRVLQLG